MLRRATDALLPRGLRARLRETFGELAYARRSYSQEGEDLVLARLFDGRGEPGVYVDVGAHHPHRYSNTQLLFRRGWRGINIDARPGSMAPFRRFRPRDVNLEVGVSRTAGRLEYFDFMEPALGTFDAALADARLGGGWPLRGRIEVECLPLAVILERHLGELQARTIELLTIDVEGLDLDVLQSNDWARYRPQVVVAELLGTDLARAAASPVAAFLQAQGYALHSKLVNSALFVADVDSPAQAAHQP